MNRFDLYSRAYKYLSTRLSGRALSLSLSSLLLPSTPRPRRRSKKERSKRGTIPTNARSLARKSRADISILSTDDTNDGFVRKSSLLREDEEKGKTRREKEWTKKESRFVFLFSFLFFSFLLFSPPFLAIINARPGQEGGRRGREGGGREGVTGAGRISGNKSEVEFEKGIAKARCEVPQRLLAARLAPIGFVSGNKRLAIACRPRNSQESIRCPYPSYRSTNDARFDDRPLPPP